MFDIIEDFHRPLDAHLVSINNQQPLVNEDPRMNVFTSEPILSFNPFAFTATYNPNCWASHLNLRQICWHDTDGRIGNGIAISPRHIVCSEHGNEPDAGHYLMWAGATNPDGSPADTITRQIIDVIYQISIDGIIGTPNPGNEGAFRMLYVDRDMPLQLIGEIFKPTDLPEIPDPAFPGTNFKISQMVGAPVVFVNQFYEATIHQFSTVGTSVYNAQGQLITPGLWGGRVVRPGDVRGSETIANIREYNPRRDLQNKLSKDFVTGDSGSPAFMVYRNSSLFYVGNAVTAGFSGGAGQGVVLLYKAYETILQAVRILNDRHPEAPPYMPGSKPIAERPAWEELPPFVPPPSGPLG